MLRCAARVVVRVVPPTEIDRRGLHRSNLDGLIACLAALSPPAEACLVDGFRLGPRAPAHRAVTDGDEKSAAIAAASIVAKVTRDRYMRRADALYPAFGFSSHVGYITPVPLGRRPGARPERDPPPLVPGALLPRRRGACGGPGRARGGRRRGLAPGRSARPPSGGRAGTTACAATACSTRTCWGGRNELDLVVRRGRVLVFCEVKFKGGDGLRRSARDGRRREAAPRTAGRGVVWLERHPELADLRACGIDVVAVRGRRLRADRRRGVGGAAPNRVEAVAPTQDALYADIDLELSWSERELPQRERTKHVHGLHPYLGKFIPQLVEVLLGALLPARRSACSTRSPAPARRSCRRSRAGWTRPASTSPPSTRCSWR